MQKIIQHREESNTTKEAGRNELKLIPLYEDYMMYMIKLLHQLPRVEKFNLGTEYKNIMYETYRNIVYISKIEDRNKMYYLNKIDADINVQRVFLRIMKDEKFISIEKFNVVMYQKLLEIGKVLGGLIKFYAKNNKK